VLAVHPIREKMLRALSLDPRIESVLEGDKVAAVRKIQLGGPDNIFVSTDLSKATDLISHEVAWALWSGILEHDSLLTR
jgi:hypothetical protein